MDFGYRIPSIKAGIQTPPAESKARQELWQQTNPPAGTSNGNSKESATSTVTSILDIMLKAGILSLVVVFVAASLYYGSFVRIWEITIARGRIFSFFTYASVSYSAITPLARFSNSAASIFLLSSSNRSKIDLPAISFFCCFIFTALSFYPCRN